MVQMRQKAAEGWKKRLRDAGLRVTRHRLRAIELLEAANRPLTHAELYDGFEKGLVDRTTVFRILMSLVRVGFVSRRDQGDHLWRYALAGTAPPRARFECEGCGAVSELPPMTVSFVSERLPDAVASWRCAVKFVGLCGTCS
ncbi:MAG: Fur family transcriptional regulator [Archangium sp.]